jgi:hypothetical protein
MCNPQISACFILAVICVGCLIGCGSGSTTNTSDTGPNKCRHLWERRLHTHEHTDQSDQSMCCRSIWIRRI